MTRRAKKKVVKDSERECPKSLQWDSGRASVESSSSLHVLVTWLTKPENIDRWHRKKSAVTCDEIIKALALNGISQRELGDARKTMELLEKKFASAASYLSLKDQMDAFQRGEADQEVVAEVLRLCPSFRELVPVFGKATQLTAKDGFVGVTAATSTTEESSQTASLASVTAAATCGSNIAAGKWKESLEKDQRNAVAQEKKQEKVFSGLNIGYKSDTGEGDTRTGGEKERRTSDNSGASATTNAVRECNATDVNVATEDKSSDLDENDENEEDGQRNDVDAVEEGEAVAGIQGNETKQNIDDDDNDGNDNVEEKQKESGQVMDKSAVESSDEEEKVQAKTCLKVSRVLKTKQQPSEDEGSSSEENDSEGETKVREEEHDDEYDREDQIQLAQSDEVGEDDDDDEDEDEEIAQLAEADEDGEKIAAVIEADEEETNNVEEMEETEEEEMEDEPEQGDAKAEKSESSSSESEVECADSEEEIPSTQLRVDMDIEEVSNYDSKRKNEGDDDAGMEEESQRSAGQQQATRKRISSNDSISSSTKRAREDSDATRDLEREAFIERVKQERDQRDALFELERAKLACELQAKQIQLAMERSLARKKLLGAGVDPAEVDRILPL